MSWLAFVLSVIAAPIASAQPTDAQPAAAPSGLQLLLPETQEPQCAMPAGMLQVPDASDPRFFATGPTARLDQEELSAGTLEPLMSVRYDDGILNLLVLGMPVRKSLGLTLAGWRPHWPIC
jgi:hypothetical protein